MQDKPPPVPPQTPSAIRRVRESTSLKIIVIGLLVLVLLIPAAMVQGLIHERKHRQASVLREISSKWGSEQTVTGPILSLPYRDARAGRRSDEYKIIHYLHILPDKLNASGKIDPEIRYRGIYEAVLYSTDIEVTGTFSVPDLERLGIDERDVLWDRATLSLGISDMKGVMNAMDVTVGETSVVMNPGVSPGEVIPAGVTGQLTLDRRTEALAFSTDIELNGSVRLAFAPLGKKTSVTLSSTWESPSFEGNYLPAKRSISDNGFEAEWSVLHLNRSYPQLWQDRSYDTAGSHFGVKLVIPADAYQKATRTAKYAVMFIALTFLAFFISEVMTKIRIHPFQYLLIGLALIIFYTLLISISEHLSFGRGYLIASVATVLLVTGYARSVLRKKSLAVMVGSLLTLLYGYLYAVLQLEDYALLMGSIGLFVILAAVMYLTRKINWYHAGTGE